MIKPAFCKQDSCTLVQSNSGVSYDERFDTYEIQVGGDRSGRILQTLFFCLSCGAPMPKSRREEWFDEIEKLGIDPFGDAVPEEHQSDAWRRAND